MNMVNTDNLQLTTCGQGTAWRKYKGGIVEDIRVKIREAICHNAEDLEKALDEIMVVVECEFDKVYASADRLWDNVTDVVDAQHIIDHLESFCRTELKDLKIL